MGFFPFNTFSFFAQVFFSVSLSYFDTITHCICKLIAQKQRAWKDFENENFI